MSTLIIALLIAYVTYKITYHLIQKKGSCEECSDTSCGVKQLQKPNLKKFSKE
ncbi:hypothetical protein [Streptococcus ferus]|uniref:FeoB-associated Cys-rich membrane protein n=1 Tax=Streptococcus ferus TaxID=1345 RepID=A0A2X3VE13_9STRE|nr:hypothetical protein [Streptococcus ferus]SQF39704.1 Uncharacterised protein [Streptococcus ferus]